MGNGNGTFGPPQTFAAGLKPAAPSAVDINGDGIPDLVIPDDGENTISVLLGSGNGTFFPIPAIATPTYGVSDLIIGDIQGDGSPDIILIRNRLIPTPSLYSSMSRFPAAAPSQQTRQRPIISALQLPPQ